MNLICLPLFVFVGVTVWIAGWSKALEITIVSLFICLLFGIGFGVLLPLSVLPRILIAVGYLAYLSFGGDEQQLVKTTVALEA